MTVEGHQERKIITRVSSPSNSYLYMSVDHTVFSVEENFDITFHANAKPKDGYIYYMVRVSILDHKPSICRKL